MTPLYIGAPAVACTRACILPSRREARRCFCVRRSDSDGASHRLLRVLAERLARNGIAIDALRPLRRRRLARHRRAARSDRLAERRPDGARAPGGLIGLQPHRLDGAEAGRQRLHARGICKSAVAAARRALRADSPTVVPTSASFGVGMSLCSMPNSGGRRKHGGGSRAERSAGRCRSDPRQTFGIAISGRPAPRGGRVGLARPCSGKSRRKRRSWSTRAGLRN